MLGAFYPYEYCQSVFAIDYRKLYEKGFRGLVFDIDNTLVHHDDDSTPQVDALFACLHQMGFRTLLLSDNGEVRIKRFMKNIDTLYIANAGKPSVESYEKALILLDLPKEQTVCIGDQIFKDILGANKCGIPSILVHYIQLPGETKIGKARYVEKLILRCYRRNRKLRSRLGDIRTDEERTSYAVEQKKAIL